MKRGTSFVCALERARSQLPGDLRDQCDAYLSVLVRVIQIDKRVHRQNVDKFPLDAELKGDRSDLVGVYHTAVEFARKTLIMIRMKMRASIPLASRLCAYWNPPTTRFPATSSVVGSRYD